MQPRLLTWCSFLLCVVAGGLSCGGSTAGLVCTKQLDCVQPDKPICSLAICMGCNQDQDCKDNWTARKQETDAQMMSMPDPVLPLVACEASTGACRECLTEAHCAEARPDKPDLRVCDPGARVCVGCLLSSDCMNNAATSKDGLLTCDTANKKCIDCTSDTDCAGRAGMTYCAAGRCGACKTNTECAGVQGKPACTTPAGSVRTQCVECKDDTTCTTDAKPACNTATNTCGPCTGKPANFCETRNAMRPACDAAGACLPCSKHEECASGVCYRPGDYAPPAALSTLLPGQCVPMASVKATDPASIVADIGGTVPYLKLAAGNYPELTVNREVVLVGSASLSHKDPTQVKSSLSHITVSGGRLVLYDLKVEAAQAGKPLMTATGGAKVHARLVRFINQMMHRGIDVSASQAGAEVRVTQSLFTTEWEAILLNSSVPNLTYVLTHNQFIRSASPGHVNAVLLGLSAAGTFAFNTLYANQQGITCNNSQTVSDSVVTGIGLAVNGCTEQRITKTTMLTDFTESPAGVFHPIANLANMLVDMGQTPTPAMPFDFYGDARPKGGSYDRGAEEIR